MTTKSSTATFKQNIEELVQSKDIKSTFADNLVKLSKYLIGLNRRKIPRVNFSGPSVYFHQQAIIAAHKGKFFGTERDREDHLKMIYAVLPSWGMHRMGDTKTKVINFGGFTSKIVAIEDDLRTLWKDYRNKTIAAVEGDDLALIVKLIFKIHVSESDSFLVSSSKTLHHILPNLFPPIDRAYSIRFMRRTHGNYYSSDFQISGTPKERKGKEEYLAKEFIIGMKAFIKDHEDIMRCYLKDEDYEEGDFNTSLPKIFDNLIVSIVGPKPKSGKS